MRKPSHFVLCTLVSLLVLGMAKPNPYFYVFAAATLLASLRYRFLDKRVVDNIYYTVGILGVALVFSANSVDRELSSIEMAIARLDGRHAENKLKQAKLQLASDYPNAILEALKSQSVAFQIPATVVKPGNEVSMARASASAEAYRRDIERFRDAIEPMDLEELREAKIEFPSCKGDLAVGAHEFRTIDAYTWLIAPDALQNEQSEAQNEEAEITKLRSLSQKKAEQLRSFRADIAILPRRALSHLWPFIAVLLLAMKIAIKPACRTTNDE
ncbi:hypothetical protein Pla123a_44670 [Posidoniimonas polymericola]|uniref:Uncharacterized protein n=1 Tax=Posidoniimonas polymericola TaxID=2528002 RepID=A0A5C5XUU1_9BACT|nr:hypothetical protein [Posidoniimonas polymericola]TWT67037.1 hypothetical protein Pla123a_44670 [Posidoniimonas polymericola]